MEKTSSQYSDLIQKILRGLAKIRMDAGAWIDSESEEAGKETQVFKISECLRPFYLASSISADLRPFPLSNDLLYKDTALCLRQINKVGFFPSPYSPIPGALDQYTDFAAFTLDFCDLVYNFWSDIPGRGKTLADLSGVVAQRAVDFLLTPDNYLFDVKGCRWGGTNKYKRSKIVEEFYTDTYFTALVVLALNNVIKSPVMSLGDSRKNEIKLRISQAVSWIADRFDGDFITGDEEKSNRKLLYSTWGLRALIETYQIHDKSMKGRIKTIANAYLTELRNRKEFTYEQVYLTILSEDVGEPLYYDDRSGLGGILLTLISLGDVSDLEQLLESTEYALLLERVFSAVLSLRDPISGLWYNQQLILSIHSYLTEALLKLDKQGIGFSSRLEVSSYLIRAAVKEVLTDETIINSLQQAVFERLLRLIERSKQERTIDQQMSNMKDHSNGDVRTQSSTVPRKKGSVKPTTR